MKPFLLYTLARVLMFAAAWALVWLVASVWLEWTSVTALWTALLAMAVSSVASVFVLRGVRQQLAVRVQGRAQRMHERLEASKRKEDVD